MHKSYSIAQAKNHLSHLVHEAEEKGPIELTRRGKTVAVVLSTEDYRRMGQPRLDLVDIYEKIRTRYNMSSLGIDPEEIFDSVEDRSPGKDFGW